MDSNYSTLGGSHTLLTESFNLLFSNNNHNQIENFQNAVVTNGANGLAGANGLVGANVLAVANGQQPMKTNMPSVEGINNILKPDEKCIEVCVLNHTPVMLYLFSGVSANVPVPVQSIPDEKDVDLDMYKVNIDNLNYLFNQHSCREVLFKFENSVSCTLGHFYAADLQDVPGYSDEMISAAKIKAVLDFYKPMNCDIIELNFTNNTGRSWFLYEVSNNKPYTVTNNGVEIRNGETKVKKLDLHIGSSIYVSPITMYPGENMTNPRIEMIPQLVLMSGKLIAKVDAVDCNCPKSCPYTPKLNNVYCSIK